MSITADLKLPSDEELTVPEVNLSSPALRASAFHFGKYCEAESNEFMMCRQELQDPRKCLEEGKAVTNCALNFFRKMKKSCSEEFEQYANCLDKSSCSNEFRYCRKTQAVFDKCVFETLGQERPEYGYFCRARIHDSKRPKPQPEPKEIYPNTPEKLPEDYPRPAAKYGSRFHISN